MSDLARKRFHGWRFDPKNPRDVELAEWVQNDIEHGRINIGEICKDLLYAYYVYVRGKGDYVSSGNLFLGLFRETLENSLKDLLSGMNLSLPRIEAEPEPEKPSKVENADRAKKMLSFTAGKMNWNQ